MGLDYGDRRIGVALSDFLQMIASGHSTYFRSDDEGVDIEYFAQLAKDNMVEEIVIGLPLNMQGEEQTICEKVRDFGQKLSNATKLDIKYIDERLTSAEAENIIKLTVKTWQERKSLIDMVSAVIILQEYLDIKGSKRI